MLFNRRRISELEAEIKSLRQKLRDAEAVVAERDREIEKLRRNCTDGEVAMHQEVKGNGKLQLATNSSISPQSGENPGKIKKLKQDFQEGEGVLTNQKVPVINLSTAEFQSIDYMVQNLNEFILHSEVTVTDNPYVFYWFRCHPLQPEDEYLYAHLPLVSLSDASTDWSSVVLAGPDFSDEHKRQRAYHLLQQAVSESVFEDAKRENVHSNDKERHRHSKILAKIFKKYSVDAIFNSTDLDLQAKIEEVIILQYGKETAQLKLRLNLKRPFVEPKYKKLMVDQFDEFGESLTKYIYYDVGDLLAGIVLSKDFEGEFKLFSQPEEDLVLFAQQHMDHWIANDNMQSIPENGHDFEHWVAAKLKECGWTASVTQASGDDGVDVIAVRNDVSVAVQCKRFKGSVGNKAVQEIYSGMKHMQLDRAVVISTGQYTKAAQNLASTTGVLLLSEHDIQHLWDLLQK